VGASAPPSANAALAAGPNSASGMPPNSCTVSSAGGGATCSALMTLQKYSTSAASCMPPCNQSHNIQCTCCFSHLSQVEMLKCACKALQQLA
jgi:hypothetical protein